MKQYQFNDSLWIKAYSSADLGITENVTTFGAAVWQYDFETAAFNEMAILFKYTLGAGVTYYLTLSAMDTTGNVVGSAISQIAGVTAGNQLLAVLSPIYPNYGYYDITGVGSGGFGSRVPMGAFEKVRLALTRTAGATETTINRLNVNLRRL